MSSSFYHRQPRLEVLSRLPERDDGRPPLLFVHGAFAGAWCWDEHFLPFFADQGWPAYAVSLRGHGNSEGHERLMWTSLADYVADLTQVVAQVPRAPVLVGHSMGGMVVQKFLERGHAPGAVLMASVPPDGLGQSSLWLTLTDPWLSWELFLIQFAGPHLATLGGARRAIFSADLSEVLVMRYFCRMQAESQRVLADLHGLDLPRRRPLGEPLRDGDGRSVPVLVLGAYKDALVPRFAVRATADAYGTEAEFFPETAHAMMLEANWPAVARRIQEWLATRGLDRPA